MAWDPDTAQDEFYDRAFGPSLKYGSVAGAVAGALMGFAFAGIGGAMAFAFGGAIVVALLSIVGVMVVGGVIGASHHLLGCAVLMGAILILMMFFGLAGALWGVGD